MLVPTAARGSAALALIEQFVKKSLLMKRGVIFTGVSHLHFGSHGPKDPVGGPRRHGPAWKSSKIRCPVFPFCVPLLVLALPCLNRVPPSPVLVKDKRSLRLTLPVFTFHPTLPIHPKQDCFLLFFHTPLAVSKTAVLFLAGQVTRNETVPFWTVNSTLCRGLRSLTFLFNSRGFRAGPSTTAIVLHLKNHRYTS